MDKFTKRQQSTGADTKTTVYNPEEYLADPLVFEVFTNEGVLETVNLSRYRDGDAAGEIIGFPSLINDLLPVIKRRVSNRSRQGVASWLGRRLPALFRFTTLIYKEIGFVFEDSKSFGSEDGAVLKEFILFSKIGPRDGRKCFTAIRSLLLEARGDEAPTLHWPDIEVGRDLRVHPDVNPEAVKEIYHTCKRVLSRAGDSERRGDLWVSTGSRPESQPKSSTRAAGQRGSIKNQAWYNHANLAVLMRDCMRQRITGEEWVCAETEAKLHTHLSRFAGTYAGITFPELTEALAPSFQEVIASVLVLSMETGWIDTVRGIDLTDEWFNVRSGSDQNNKTASVVLFARRPKTSRRVTAIGQAGSRFRSFKVIKSLERRSAFLRSCLIERRNRLAHSTAPDAVKEVYEIDLKLKSPWLFFNSKGRGAKAVGIFVGQQMVRGLNSIKKDTLSSLSTLKLSDETLLSGIETLKWSDLRDAFAAHIFSKSGGNMFVVKRALDHNDVSVTRHYLRQRRMIKDRFDTFRKMVEFGLEEIAAGRSLDPTLIFLSNHISDFGSEHRGRLSSFRTRQGLGCKDPTDPSPFLAPRHEPGSLCAVQRCVLCRQGVVFSSAWSGLARRHAELVWLRGRSNAVRWIASTFAWEIDAIEYLRDTVFLESKGSFVRDSQEWQANLEAGTAFLFDDPELMGLSI